MAIISAVSSHGMMRNRTIYYERQQNETNFDRGINLQQHFNVFIGGAFLSFAITLLCVVCYCFNKIINKNSMALYRRHLMEAANNQNVDIYTVEQFYGETEAHAPLCETQSAQSVLPPSYEDVMAAEKAILKKYAKICTSTKCCEHSQLNRSSNPEQSPTDSAHIVESPRENPMTDDVNAKPDANNQPTDSNIYDDNGNEVAGCQEPPSTCCILAHTSNENTCCRVLKDCSCVDNCLEHCNSVGNNITNTSANTTSTPGEVEEVNGNNLTTSTDENNTLDTNNNTERMETRSDQCQCTHQRCQDSPVEFDVLSDNGIVRMDMSKIIDRTGLPSYDAAIKLESFGYV
ncbi:uncharacterized protein LOC129575624 isoform X2 [Sitodiplosis mosellana]|uniref:uncharacterized protein LOC129575624 isoform X2 n=1 Tax=Sitodiplosis mosellana TaxID=263140 RepID=UPI002443905F|nr:uncharacterized protein LOC129575624 isoform X2 [Sitodiplosis mosellana]